MIDFHGQVAVVTGGGRGLGRVYARELARRGAAVVVNDPGGSMGGDGADEAVADRVVEEIEAESRHTTLWTTPRAVTRSSAPPSRSSAGWTR